MSVEEGKKSADKKSAGKSSPATPITGTSQPDTNRFARLYTNFGRIMSETTSRQKLIALIGFLVFIIVILFIIVIVFVTRPGCQLIQDMDTLPNRHLRDSPGIRLDFQGYFVFNRAAESHYYYAPILPLEMKAVRRMDLAYNIQRAEIDLDCAKFQIVKRSSGDHEMTVKFANAYGGVRSCLIRKFAVVKSQACTSFYTDETIGYLKIERFDINWSDDQLTTTNKQL